MYINSQVQKSGQYSTLVPFLQIGISMGLGQSDEFSLKN